MLNLLNFKHFLYPKKGIESSLAAFSAVPLFLSTTQTSPYHMLLHVLFVRRAQNLLSALKKILKNKNFARKYWKRGERVWKRGERAEKAREKSLFCTERGGAEEGAEFSRTFFWVISASIKGRPKQFFANSKNILFV